MKKVFFSLLILLLAACRLSGEATPGAVQDGGGTVPHEGRWGIYHFDLASGETELVYSSSTEIASLRLNEAGDRLLFSQKVGGQDVLNEEIFTLDTDGSDLTQVTHNNTWDLYPAWSPDGSRIAFLSQRSGSLGIFVMNGNGGDEQVLNDSSAHEADIDWVGERIVFTRDSSIWIMQSDGSDIRQLTHPPRAGEWGQANLPFGDYDPRLSPDGTMVVFERLVDDSSPNGNYDLYLLDLASGEERRLTETGYSQGLAQWSHDGQALVYIVAAIGEAGQFDLYLLNSDGSGNRNITPSYFPAEFLCHWGIFASDDSSIYFIGEWWSME